MIAIHRGTRLELSRRLVQSKLDNYRSRLPLAKEILNRLINRRKEALNEFKSLAKSDRQTSAVSAKSIVASVRHSANLEKAIGNQTSENNSINSTLRECYVALKKLDDAILRNNLDQKCILEQSRGEEIVNLTYLSRLDGSGSASNLDANMIGSDSAVPSMGEHSSESETTFTVSEGEISLCLPFSSHPEIKLRDEGDCSVALVLDWNKYVRPVKETAQLRRLVEELKSSGVRLSRVTGV